MGNSKQGLQQLRLCVNQEAVHNHDRSWWLPLRQVWEDLYSSLCDHTHNTYEHDDCSTLFSVTSALLSTGLCDFPLQHSLPLQLLLASQYSLIHAISIALYDNHWRVARPIFLFMLEFFVLPSRVAGVRTGTTLDLVMTSCLIFFAAMLAYLHFSCSTPGHLSDSTLLSYMGSLQRM